MCLFGFMKATKFRDSSEYSRCVQNVLIKSCLPCQILYKTKKKFLSAERPRYEFSATGFSPVPELSFLSAPIWGGKKGEFRDRTIQGYAGLVSSGFPSKIA